MDSIPTWPTMLMPSPSAPFRSLRFGIAATALTLLALGTYAHWIAPSRLEVTHHTLALPGLRSKVTVALLSDLHSRSIGVVERRLLSALASANPDVILVAGDFISDVGTYDECAPILRSLRARLGTWVVPGNWEYWKPAPDLRAFVEGVGARLLVNQSRPLRPDLWLIGLDDLCAGHPDSNLAMRGVPAHVARIGLFHSPALFPIVADRLHLALSGHTHGGQIRLPRLPPLWLPPASGSFGSGWYSANASRTYVSRGIGMTIYPFRLGCRPELALFELQPASTSSVTP